MNQTRPTSIWTVMVLIFLGLTACDKSDGLPTGGAPATPSESTQPPGSASTVEVAPPATPAVVSYSQFMNDPTRATQIVTKRYQQSSSGSWDSKYCAKGVDCLNNVVSIYSDLGGCAGVLVATDQVLTNRHCVESLIQDGQYSGLISVMAPKKRANPGTIGSSSSVLNIKFISPHQFKAEGLSPDFALLTLRQPLKGVTPVKISFDGIQNGETYFTYGHSPYGDAKEPLAIEKRTCKAVYNTTFSPNFNSAFFPVVKFADCTVGPGNSGSPLYNRRGELVALIGGQFSPSTTLALGQLARHSLRNTKTTLSNIGWGTNLACMSVIFDSSKPIPASCDLGFASATKQVKFSDELETKLKGAFDAVPKGDSKFRYKLTRASETEQTAGFITQTLMLRVPECIEPEALAALTTDTQSDVEHLYSSAVLSKYWEVTSEITPVQTLALNVALDLKKLKSNGTSPIEITVQGISFYKGQLDICR